MALKYSLPVPNQTSVSVGFLDQPDVTPIDRATLEFALEDDAGSIPNGNELLATYERDLQTAHRLTGVLIFSFREDEPLSQDGIKQHSTPPTQEEQEAAGEKFLKNSDIRVAIDRHFLETYKRVPTMEEVKEVISNYADEALVEKRWLFGINSNLKQRIHAEDSKPIEVYLPAEDPDEHGVFIPLRELEETRKSLKPYRAPGDKKRNPLFLPLGYAHGMDRCGALGYLPYKWKKLFLIPIDIYQQVLRAYIKCCARIVPMLEEAHAHM
jgi:hypothetical protein